MSNATRHVVDKSTWGDGPWQQEPDRVQWEHAGLDCLMVRVQTHGAWCGYVGVPQGHPAHGKGYDDASLESIEVHGGLTYADACQGRICHVPAPGRPDDVWWLGFDTAHCFDLSPSMSARMKSYGLDREPFASEVYRDQAYVAAETEALARQLAAMS